MVMGTNFFQVESFFETENGENLTVAIGLTTFGNPVVIQNEEIGYLVISERISEKDCELGTAVYVSPSQLERFTTIGNDYVALMKVRSGQPFVYYAGAAWSGDPRFSPFDKWNEITQSQSWNVLNNLYRLK